MFAIDKAPFPKDVLESRIAVLEAIEKRRSIVFFAILGLILMFVIVACIVDLVQAPGPLITIRPPDPYNITRALAQNSMLPPLLLGIFFFLISFWAVYFCAFKPIEDEISTLSSMEPLDAPKLLQIAERRVTVKAYINAIAGLGRMPTQGEFNMIIEYDQSIDEQMEIQKACDIICAGEL